jgi:hypothetical protein
MISEDYYDNDNLTCLLPRKTADFGKLCNTIFAVDEGIRFVGIIEKMGKLVAGGMRKGVTPLEADEDKQKLYLEFALRNAMRHDFDPEFGKVVYAFSEREKIKFATFPFAENLVLISIEKNTPHAPIIDAVLKVLRG